MGKAVASRFGYWNGEQNSGLMNFDSVPGNPVCHLPRLVSFKEKRLRKPESNIQKRFEDMKSEFPPEIFQEGK